MVSNDTIDLFRHRPVKASQPCLDMHYGNLQFCRRQRASKGGIGIAKDNHPIWVLFHENWLNSFEYPSSLHSMCARANLEVIVGGWNSQLIKELGRHTIIVVLPGMDNDLLMREAQGTTDRFELHKLRTRSNDCCQLHYLYLPLSWYPQGAPLHSECPKRAVYWCPL